MAFGWAARKVKIKIGAGTVQLSRNPLALWPLRPMGAWAEMEAKTARLKADALIRIIFSNCTTTQRVLSLQLAYLQP